MATEISELDEQIITQVEYYFGDANLRKDKFTRQTIDENDGWMPIETLLKFNRLKKLSEEQEVIAAALKKSSSGLLEVAEDNSKVRRNPSRPVPEWNDSVKKETNMRTVYAKGFPTDYDLEKIEAFLAEAGFGKKELSNVVMRRNLDSREFKGSVFIEFHQVETAEKFVAGTYRIPDAEEDLIVLSRNQYFQKKDDERKELKTKLRESALAAAGEAAAEGGEAGELKYENGCVLAFDACGPNTTRELLKEIFGKEESVEWVNFTKGDANGKVRFTGAGAAERVLETIRKDNEEGKMEIDGIQAQCSVLTGDEEEEYYKEVRREVANVKARNKQNRLNHFRHTGRGRGRGNKRRGPGGFEPRAKRSRD